MTPRSFLISRGLPQGSVLSPILFAFLWIISLSPTCCTSEVCWWYQRNHVHLQLLNWQLRRKLVMWQSIAGSTVENERRKVQNALSCSNILLSLKTALCQKKNRSGDLHLLYTVLFRSVLDYTLFMLLLASKRLVMKQNKIDSRAHRLIWNIPFDAEFEVKCGCRKSMSHRLLKCERSARYVTSYIYI